MHMYIHTIEPWIPYYLYIYVYIYSRFYNYYSYLKNYIQIKAYASLFQDAAMNISLTAYIQPVSIKS